ncbi:hypothetical protein PB2503_09919 [Parvularcula bermudensis HTCC2503]|uniref:Uncharacterized protein n=1 Tax=Parvularcula bermudensis (strain ATCC BAA-594 / HTCC2503 / KCTC 12087) TaxID=314260 RepID=E0TEF0_PARBH|nr:hypothetical protein [Parvularcula bermudensis]ADM10036.1 hypothetical protein PB2503_09919 [Parvularcula bermudensis HTCC2503]
MTKECHVCGSDARFWPRFGDYDRVTCEWCGDYKIMDKVVQSDKWKEAPIERRMGELEAARQAASVELPLIAQPFRTGGKKKSRVRPAGRAG